jgi:hypothetical protein
LRLVIIESPYAARKDGEWDPAGVEENLRYLRAAMHDCLLRGEAPYASHALYTQEGVLNDQVPEERKLGIAAGFAWNRRAEASVFYVDRGISSGMREGIKNAVSEQRPIEFRTIREINPTTAGYIEELEKAIGAAYIEVAKERLEESKKWSDDFA